MTDALLLATAALLPALGLTRVSHESLARVRHAVLWLVGLLVVATVGLREPWLGVIGLYLLFWWRQPAHLDPLGRAPWEKTRVIGWWCAIGGLWFLALAAPPWIWTWLPLAWGAWAWVCSAAMAWQVWRGDPAKVRGWWGGRAQAGAFLALILPVLPLWAWPGPLVGLWLSGPSWSAVAALSAAIVWRWPQAMVWGPIVTCSLVAALLVARQVPVGGRAIGEWTPRGDTLDSLWQRLALLRWAWRTRAFWGVGPGVTPYLHMQAHARGHLPEPTGTLHNEPAQLASEYGMAGVLACLLFVSRVGTGLQLGDPWSAAVIAGMVLSLGSMALRVASLGAIFLLMAAEVAGR